MDNDFGWHYLPIVGWRKVDAAGLEHLKRQAAREDGQLLILTSDKEAAAGLSTLTDNSSSTDKGSEKIGDVQGNGAETTETG